MMSEFYCWNCGKYKNIESRIKRPNRRDICAACAEKAKSLPKK